MKLSNKKKRTFQPVTASIYSSLKSQDTHAWDEFGVEIPSEDLEKIVSVGDVISYINDKAN